MCRGGGGAEENRVRPFSSRRCRLREPKFPRRKSGYPSFINHRTAAAVAAADAVTVFCSARHFRGENNKIDDKLCLLNVAGRVWTT